MNRFIGIVSGAMLAGGVGSYVAPEAPWYVIFMVVIGAALFGGTVGAIADKE